MNIIIWLYNIIDFFIMIYQGKIITLFIKIYFNLNKIFITMILLDLFLNN